MSAKRRRWLIIGLVLALGGLAVYVGWGDESPPDTSDLVVDRPQVPPESNAYTYIMQAGKVAVVNFALIQPGATYYQPADIAVILTANAATLEQADKALACPEFQFPPEAVRWPGIDFDRAEYVTHSLLALRASDWFSKGDEDRAFDDALQLMQLEGRIRAAQGPLPSDVYGWASATDWIKYWVPRTTLGAAHLKQLAAEVGRHPVRREDLAGTLRAQYAVDAQLIDLIKAGDPVLARTVKLDPRWLPPGPLSDFGIKPNTTKRMMAEALRAQSAAAALPWPQGNPMWRKWEDEFNHQESAFAYLFQIPIPMSVMANGYGKTFYYWEAQHMPYVNPLHLSRADAINDVGMTQLLLALRAYKIEKGDLPQHLEDLVPDYLAALPLDEFDGQPLKYDRPGKALYTAVPDPSAGSIAKLGYPSQNGYTVARREPITF